MRKGEANIMISDEEFAERRRTMQYQSPESQTPWQAMFRANVAQFDEGMVLKDAVNYQRIAEKGVPRNNH